MVRTFSCVRWAGRLASGLLCLAALAIVGCGGGTGNVSGVVKVDGKPMPGGTVIFAAQSGSKAVVRGTIKPDGSYAVTNVPVGTAKIAIAPPPPAKPKNALKPPAGGSGVIETDQNKMAAMMGGKAAPPPEVPAEKIPPIAKKFQDPEKSGLTYDVTKGEQTKEIDIGGK